MSLRVVYVRFYVCSLFALAMGLLVPAGLAGQDPPQDPAQEPSLDSLALAFEREVFTYPEFERRNPFRTLAEGTGGGPQFEDLVLVGTLLSPFAGESIAIFAEGTRTVTPAAAGGRETVTVEITGGMFRLREGETVGNLSVSRIELQQVTIEFDEFGVTESRIMQLPRATSGGGP